MSYQLHMKGHGDPRTLYQIDSLYAWKHNEYSPPVIAEVSPTHRCNQRCRFCYTSNRMSPKEALRDDILVRTFADIADAGVQTLLIQGTGEPLLHNALPEAIDAGAQRKLTIGLTTNGTLLGRQLQDKILHNLFYVLFSVVEADSQRYAYLHGCSEDHWERLIVNINNAVTLRRKNDLAIALMATMYLYEDNFAHAYDIVKYLKEAGLDYVIVQEATYQDFSPAGRMSMASDCFSAAQIQEMRDKVSSLSDDDFVVKVRFPLNNDVFCAGLSREQWVPDRCHGVNFYTLIGADGEVYPCWRAWGKPEYSYGSLYERRFEEIWKGGRRKEIQTRINGTPPEGCECTVCNLQQLNQILLKCKLADSRWKGFIT